MTVERGQRVMVVEPDRTREGVVRSVKPTADHTWVEVAMEDGVWVVPEEMCNPA